MRTYLLTYHSLTHRDFAQLVHTNYIYTYITVHRIFIYLRTNHTDCTQSKISSNACSSFHTYINTYIHTYLHTNIHTSPSQSHHTSHSHFAGSSTLPRSVGSRITDVDVGGQQQKAMANATSSTSLYDNVAGSGGIGTQSMNAVGGQGKCIIYETHIHMYICT